MAAVVVVVAQADDLPAKRKRPLGGALSQWAT